MPNALVKAHRLLAIGLGLFILSHLAIHLTAIAGPNTHIAVLSKFQDVYRNGLIEPLLFLAIIVQVFIGGKLVWRRYKAPEKGFWSWAQILSGLYLAMFMIVHGSAALVTRYLVGLETNFYWAAGTLNIFPLPYLFAPYYWLGIMSVFVHLGAAIHFGWPKAGKLPLALAVLGAVISSLIVVTFAGGFYEITLPQEVIDSFNKYIPK